MDSSWVLLLSVMLALTAITVCGARVVRRRSKAPPTQTELVQSAICQTELRMHNRALEDIRVQYELDGLRAQERFLRNITMNEQLAERNPGRWIPATDRTVAAAP